MNTPPQPSSEQSLRAENAELRARLEEAQDILRAIRAGEVDALVVEEDAGLRIFTLQGLDAEQSRLRGAMLAQVSDAVVTTDREDRITFLNAAAEQQYRVRGADVLGRKVTELYTRQWPSPEAEAAAWAALEERSYWRGEELHCARDGRVLPVEASIAITHDPETGGRAGLIVAIRDITERKQLEQEQAETLRLLDTLLTHAPVGFVFLDRDLRFVRINDRLAEINGLPVAAHIGKSVAEILPTLEPSLREVTERILATGLPVLDHEFSGETARESGVTRYWNENWYPVHDRRGEIIGFGGVVEEITERKRVEEALRLDERRFRGIFDSAFQFIGLTTPDGKLLEANQTALEAGGLRAENVIGKPFWECDWWTLTERTGRELRTAIGRAASGEVVRYDVDVRGAEGQAITIDFSIKPIRDEAGRVVLLIPEGRDITGLKRTEEHLRLANHRFDLAVKCSQVVLWQQDLELRFTWLHPAPGIDGSNPVGKRDEDLWERAEDAVVVVGLKRQVIETGSSLRKEFFAHIQGVRHCFEVLIEPLRDAAGLIVGITGAAIDITQHKAAEDALRESEKRLQKAISVENVGVLFFKLDGHMLDANGALERMSGYTAEELRRITDWAQLTPPEFMDATRRAGAELAEHGVTAPYEKQWIRKDGSRFWGLFSPTRLSGNGSESECVEFTIDITESKRAEEQLRMHRQLLETMVNHLPAAVALIRGSDLTFQMVNPGYQAISPGKQMVGRTISEVWPETHPLFGQRCRHVLETGEPFETDDERHEIHRDSGGPLETAYFSWSMRRIDLPSEVQPGLLLAIWETTPRKKIEVALAERTALLSGVLEGTTDVIFVKDVNGRTLLVNAAFAAAAGSTPELLVGKTVADWFPPDVAAAVRRQDEEVIASGSPVEIEETIPVAGVPRVFLTLKAPLRDGSGGVIGMLGIGRDITDRKRAEDELHRLAAELSEADRRKDVFLATLAHELRNPLAPMRNGLQIMKLTQNNGDAAERVRAMMDRQLSQLVRLVDDLLDVSRITQGKVELRVERIDLKTVLAAALEASRPAIEEAGHELTVVVPDEPIFVDGDAARLAQAVSNLLNNSSKYTRRGGHIRMTVWREDGMAMVAVKDNGIGVPPAMLDRVFDMFVQVDRALEKTTGGLGIGLSLVKGLVEMHGGNVEARSDGEGMGSEFVVRLPVVASVVAGPQRESGHTIGVVASAPRRILVVDDNVDAADSLGELLEMSGNEVRIANDGEAGIAAAAQFRPDVVLMDIGMPKLNGYEAARRIRQHPWGRSMVLVALTGWGQDDDRRKSADAGFDHHLVKPVEMDTLIKLMSSLKCPGDLDGSASAAALPSVARP